MHVKLRPPTQMVPSQQPLREGRIQTARHVVLPHRRRASAEQRPHLDVALRPGRVEADQPDVERVVALVPRRVGLHLQDRVGVFEEDRDPARTVVRPLCVDDGFPLETQDRGDLPDEPLLDLACPQSWRGREREQVIAPTDRHHPRAALLDDGVRIPRRFTRSQPRVRGS